MESSTERRSCCLHDQVDLCWVELSSIDISGKQKEQQEIQYYKVKATIETKKFSHTQEIMSIK